MDFINKLNHDGYILQVKEFIISIYGNIINYFNSVSIIKFILIFVLVILSIYIYTLIKKEYMLRSRIKYKDITVDNLKRMKWDSFEILVKKIFLSKGYSVSRIGGHGSDGGVDLIIRKKPYGKKSIIQCKRYSNNVGVSVIREMYAVGIHNKAKKVYIYTTANFSKPAYEFAKGKNIILVNGDRILEEIKQNISFNYYNKYFKR